MNDVDPIESHYTRGDLLQVIRAGVEGLGKSPETVTLDDLAPADELHVGMNIPDKAALAREVWRVLRPGGVWGVYDIMRTGDDELLFPVPWATAADESSVAPPGDYHAALTATGFEIVGERNRHDFAIEFFERLKAASAAAGGPPPLGLHLVMGASAPTKVQNMIDNIARDAIAPIELIARKASS